MLLTPLHLAALHNRPDVLRLLLLCGADVNVIGGLGLFHKSLRLASDLISNFIHIQYSISLWPSALVILRGKCCISCNKLFPNENIITTSNNNNNITNNPYIKSNNISDGCKICCKYCHCYICKNCESNHWCHAHFLFQENFLRTNNKENTGNISNRLGKVNLNGSNGDIVTTNLAGDTNLAGATRESEKESFKKKTKRKFIGIINVIILQNVYVIYVIIYVINSIYIYN